MWRCVATHGCTVRRVADIVQDSALAVLGHAIPHSPSEWMCRQRVEWGLVRRDVAFLRRLAGRNCFLLTDQSPYPPGPHKSQHHVGHHTFAWLEEEVDGLERDLMLKVHAFTGSIFHSETTAAKDTLKRKIL